MRRVVSNPAGRWRSLCSIPGMEYDHLLVSSRSKLPRIQQQPESHRQRGKQLSRSKMKKLLKQEELKQRKNTIFEQFTSHYQQQYGEERWPSLMSHLLVKPRAACLINKYCGELRIPPAPEATQVKFLQLPAYECPGQFPHPERDCRNVFDYYIMDAASILVAEALEVEEGDKILDLCAAPGGKALGILQRLDLTKGSLVANDTSEPRRRRLSKVISEYIPEPLRGGIRITRRNGIRWPQMDVYDKVLVDAPCSSERHLLHDSKHLGTWTHRRTENCAKRQLALLFAALRAVKLNGRVVYSTCSLSQQENDEIISKAMEKGKQEFEVIEMEWPVGEKTEFGWIILPDASEGWGPIYISVLKKICTSLDFYEEHLEQLGVEDDDEEFALPGGFSGSEDDQESD